jgi:tetratricopeptide (TPR) repeat protein
MTAARANGLTALWWHVARMETEQGNVEASQAAMGEVTRYAGLAVRDMAPGAPTRKIREAWPLKYEAQRQFILGNFPAAREKAAAAIRQLEPLKPDFEGAKRFRSMELADTYATLADAAYAMKDYAQAEDAARRGLAARLAVPPQNRIDAFFASEHHTQHALALARLGRLAEARTALAPALELHGKLPDAREAEWVRERRARARLAQALATPAEAQVRLAEAAALLDGLSAEIRRMVTVIRSRNEVALEQARTR